MRLRQSLLVLLLAVGLLAGACGGGDDGDDAANENATSEAESGADADDGSDTADEANESEGELPDACTVFSKDALTAAFGDPGEGNPQGEGTRRTCFYENHLIVGVSSPDQFDPALTTAENNGSKCSEVTGVGDRASFCETGTVVGALWWIADGVMYDVTFGSTDQAKFVELAGSV